VGAPDRTGRSAVDAAIVAYPTETTEQSLSTDITRARSSLVAALDAAGENVDLALSLAQIFGGEVDFNADLHDGDRIQAMYERVTRDGRPIAYGRVEGAVITNAGRRLVAIPFAAPDGTPGWYDEQGRSLKRQFLKSPLPFEPRITSGFSLSRVHPIYGDVRAHLGVDYGAPAGTSVVAVASGTVESAGWAGDAGRMVVLRHAGGYETLYLHLSSFAAGLAPGTHVAQGELIGRVGSSGAATGPHLDFRIRKSGSYVNPILEISRMPHADPMPASSMPAFALVRDRVLQELSAGSLSTKH
jgi:murein DD-endopeptidase MepM/ murein hydrolase activator NlpD